MKKTILFNLFVLIGVAVAACSQGSSPSDVAIRFMKAVKADDTATIQNLISSSDKAAGFKVKNRAFGYVIKKVTAVSEKIDGDKATVTLAITAPTKAAVAKASLQELKNIGGLIGLAALGDEGAEQLEATLAKKLSSSNVETFTKDNDFELVKESDGWKVFFNAERDEKQLALLDEASNLIEKRDLTSALAKLDEAIALGGDEKNIKKTEQLADDVRNAIAKKAEADAYRPKVVLKDVEVGKAVLGGKGVFGELKNTGNRTLSEVKILIKYLDKDGNAISEKAYSPVFYNEKSYRRNSGPLKPGYAEKFGYKASDAPSEWSGKVDVSVVDIEFLD